MAEKKQTNYEAIKEMSLPEMAAMFYIFAKPFMELLDMTKEQKAEMRDTIHNFLNSEAGQNREN